MTNTNVPEHIRKICVSPESLVREAMQVLEESHKEIVLVVDAQGRLLGTVTDGDIRRAALKGMGLEGRIGQMMFRSPTTGSPSMRPRELLSLMNRRHVLQLPLVDAQGRVVDLVLLSEMMQEKRLGSKAVVMAGGKGSRLRPITYDIPKPLLPVADKPILEIILEQLLDAGVDSIFVFTHYKAEMIERHFAGNPYPGADIRFVREEEPLGTAGGLRLIRDQLDGPFLMMNADVLTRLSFADLMQVHMRRQAVLTVATKRQEMQVPYGVVESDEGNRIVNFAEKPVVPFSFNIGIYALSPGALDYLPDGRVVDVTHLIEALVHRRQAVYEYPVDNYWIDIGRLADYERACEDVLANRF
jgi:dTDP-glucose pyrophosphorylase